MKSLQNWKLVTAAFLAAGVLSACGGSSEPGPYSPQETNVDAAQNSGQQATAAAGAAAPAATPAQRQAASAVIHADPSSFTMNSSSDFKGFNPGIWNDGHSWYECDCGSKAQGIPKDVPWNSN